MKVVQTSGMRKEAVARATLRTGKGVVRINHVIIDNYQPRYSRMRIQEALMLAGDAIKAVDIDVHVRGGGITTQADAIRLAIARGIVNYTGDEAVKNTFLNYDRQLLVADVRVKESAKPNSGGQARAKKQKSYR